jgi:hypothetical protein
MSGEPSGRSATSRNLSSPEPPHDHRQPAVLRQPGAELGRMPHTPLWRPLQVLVPSDDAALCACSGLPASKTSNRFTKDGVVMLRRSRRR